MDYDEVFERMLDGENITNEEWEFILNEVREKLKRKEVIRAQEITEVILECAELEYIYNEPVRHGWIYTTVVFTFDNENYYSFEGYYHDDYGFEDIEDQVCPRMVRKQVVVERWADEVFEDKPIVTNGDRIRQMTDEELVGILYCNQCIYQGMPECEPTDCKSGILAWLKKDDKNAGTD